MPSAEVSLGYWEAVPRLPWRSASELMRRTRWHFAALVLYIAAQAYLIPLWPVGPSWAIWPRFADGAMLVLAVAAVIGFPNWRAFPIAHRRVLTPLFTWVLMCGLSFLLVTMLLPRLGGITHPSEKAGIWGVYELARLVQFAALFALAACVPIPAGRARMLGRLTALVLVVVNVTVVLTYVGVIPHAWLVSHLPTDPHTSGPWASFGASGDSGLGTVSYNHAYVACHLMLLLMLRLSLTSSQFSVTNVGLVLMTLAAVFLSGSRAGFGGMLILLGGGLLPQWIQLGYARRLLGIATCGALLAAVCSVVPDVEVVGRLAGRLEEQGAILSRQMSVLEGFRAENLSGRTEIWSNHFYELSQQPWRWLIGGGFGSAIAAGSQAHMLVLNVIVETGVLGLCVASWLAWRVLLALWYSEPPGRPLFWGSLALLLTSLTQETFYPVPAMGHFLGLYLVAVAIALRITADRVSAKSGRPA